MAGDIASIREDSAQSETPGMHGNSMRENRETPSASVPDGGGPVWRRPGAGSPDMHAGGESDGCVVPTKRRTRVGNRRRRRAAEGRQPTKENIGQATRAGLRAGISELQGLGAVCVRQHAG